MCNLMVKDMVFCTKIEALFGKMGYFGVGMKREVQICWDYWGM